jgi:predicted DNA-binding transcriptional regulator YafY
MNDKGAPDTTPRDVVIDYTNWKGERRMRRIRPGQMYWGTSDYHPEPQWLLQAWDCEKREFRTFAMQCIHSWRSA